MQRVLFSVVLLTLISCGIKVEKTPIGTISGIIDDEKVSSTKAEVIVNSVDWQSVLNLAPNSQAKVNSKAVGLLTIPARGSRCTAFAITDSLVMTNEHCIGSQSDAYGAKLYMTFEGGSRGTPFSCGQLVIANRSLDVAVLRCSGNPGALGQVTLETERTGGLSGEGLYIIHQNCDYYMDRSCSPSKKFSPGNSMGEKYIGQARNIFYDADTLGGSSGSPVFHASTGKVVALHHHGYGAYSGGRGTSNAGVSMDQIVSFLRANVHELSDLGFDAPKVPVEPQGQDPSPQVPAATKVLTSSIRGVISSSYDVDIYKIKIRYRQPINLNLIYNIAAGDLDLYVLDSHFRELAKSISQNSEERIRGEIYPGTYYIVVQGYRYGTGEYILNLN